MPKYPTGNTRNINGGGPPPATKRDFLAPLVGPLAGAASGYRPIPALPPVPNALPEVTRRASQRLALRSLGAAAGRLYAPVAAALLAYEVYRLYNDSPSIPGATVAQGFTGIPANYTRTDCTLPYAWAGSGRFVVNTATPCVTNLGAASPTPFTNPIFFTYSEAVTGDFRRNKAEWQRTVSVPGQQFTPVEIPASVRPAIPVSPLEESPFPWPALEPLTAPQHGVAPVPQPVPYWMIPYVTPHVWTPPQVQWQRGNEVPYPEGRPGLWMPFYPDIWVPDATAVPHPSLPAGVKGVISTVQDGTSLPAWKLSTQPDGRVRFSDGPPDASSPPGKGKRERKLRLGSKLYRLMAYLASEITERTELIDAAYNALPKKLRDELHKKYAKRYRDPKSGKWRRAKVSFTEKAQAVYDQYDKMSMEQFARNYLNNMIEDFAYGKVGSFGQKAQRAVHSRGLGDGIRNSGAPSQYGETDIGRLPNTDLF